MKRYSIVPALVVIALGACSPATREQAASNGPLMMAGTQTADLVAGQKVFDDVCAACHSVQPPAKLAPPMSHVARHYRDTIPDRSQAIGRITQWLLGPAAERSLLPGHAIEMWGLMPPLELEAGQIRAVADYVWSLGDQAMDEGMEMGGGRGMQMGRDTMASHGIGMGMGGDHEMHMHRDSAHSTAMPHGMGMMHRRGMMDPDTTSKKD